MTGAKLSTIGEDLLSESDYVEFSRLVTEHAWRRFPQEEQSWIN